MRGTIIQLGGDGWGNIQGEDQKEYLFKEEDYKGIQPIEGIYVEFSVKGIMLAIDVRPVPIEGVPVTGESEIDKEETNKFVDWAYDLALEGAGPISGAEDLAREYLDKSKPLRENANALIRSQNTKAAIKGFAEGIGGVITLPVSIPSGIVVTLGMQIRMVAAIAYMGGYDLRNDRVKTFCLVCLLGGSVGETLKKLGMQVGEKMAKGLLKKIPGKLLIEINKRIGARIFVKYGTQAPVKLWKLVPIVPALIALIMDAYAMDKIGDTARDWFIGPKR